VNKDKVVSKNIHKRANEDLKKDFLFDNKPKEKKSVKKFGTGSYGK
jgi:hypothetical protein